MSKSFDQASHSRSSSMEDELRSTSITDLGGSPFHSRDSGMGLARRRAISKADKSRLMSSRERARSTSRRQGSGVPSPTLSGGGGSPAPPTKMSDGESDGNQPGVPSIKIRKPSTQALPYSDRTQSLPCELPLQPIPNGDSDTEAESNKGFKVVRQMQKMSSTESDVMVVGSEYLPSSSLANVEHSITAASAAAARSQWTSNNRSSSSSSSPEHASMQKSTPGGSPRVRSNSKPEGHQAVLKKEKSPATMSSNQSTPDKKATPDLFRKVGGASSSSEAKTTPSSERHNGDASDPFKKVGSSKLPEPEKSPAVVKKSDPFKKVGSSKLPEPENSPAVVKKSDPFKKVGSSKLPEPEKSPAVVKKSESGDLFRKVGKAPSKSPEVQRSPATEKRSDTSDLFKKVGGPPSKSERSPSLEKKSEDSGDLFRKVGGTPKMSSEKQSPKQSPVKDSKPELGAKVSEPAVVPVKVAPLMSSPPSHPAPRMPSPPKEYYQLALDELPANSKLKELIKIKLDDLN